MRLINLVLFSLLGAGFLIAAAPALAHDHRAPEVDLAVAGKSQAGQLHWESWVSGDGRVCAWYNADGTGQYPRGVAIEAGRHAARFRFFKAERPRLTISILYSASGGRTEPSGIRVAPDYRLSRRQRDGRTFWQARFPARLDQLSRRHAYIHLEAHWPDQQGCGGEQAINRHFHLKAASPLPL